MRPSGILETVLYAADLAAARSFYEDILGLPLIAAVAGRHVFFACGNQVLLVFNPEKTLQAAAGAALPVPPHGARGPGHACFRATAAELAAWRRHLEARGVAIEADFEWPGGGRSIYFRDPAGNSLEFAEPRIWGRAAQRSLRGERIVIATHNKGKLAEFAKLLAPYGVETVSAGDLGLAEPEETGATFVENARIKSQAAARASGLISISDDSGLCVAALGGEPGVYTADWAGPGRDWNRAMRLVEEKLAARGAAAPAQRRAEFVCTLCVTWPDGEERIYEGRAAGHLAWPPRGTLGHGYDPMFIPNGEVRTFAELDPAEKNRISHRAAALGKLVSDLL